MRLTEWVNRPGRALRPSILAREETTPVHYGPVAAKGKDSMNGLTIVTGGGGFIGSHLVKLLVESGQQVRVIERPGRR